MGSDDGRLATAGPAVAGIIVIRACVLAALGEETLFRGVLYNVAPAAASGERCDPRLCRGTCRDPWLPGVILPLAFIMGLGFGWVRERSGSTVPTVIVHAVHNAALIGWS